MGIRQAFRPPARVRKAGEWIEAKTDPLFHGPTCRLIAAHLDLQPEDDLLDVACGAGNFLARHATHVHRVTGLDISGIRAAMARKRLADRIAAGTAQIVAGDAGALPWPDGTFSAVTCMASLEEFTAPQAALNEMRRVLRPGGRVALTMGAKVGPAAVRKWDRLGWSVWTEADVRRMMSEAGFARVSISYGRWSGNSRLLGLLMRLLAGTDEGRFVHATKPDSHYLGDEQTMRAGQNRSQGASRVDRRLADAPVAAAGGRREPPGEPGEPPDAGQRRADRREALVDSRP